MDSALITFLANAGTAGVVVIIIVIGLLVPRWSYQKLEEENRLLKEALDLERQRAAEAASTAGTTHQLIAALTDLASERRGLPAGRDPAATWTDIT